jgi:hypothetical protein
MFVNSNMCCKSLESCSPLLIADYWLRFQGGITIAVTILENSELHIQSYGGG